MIEGYDGHQLTAEEARTVLLTWRPIKRLGQLAEYGAAYPSQQVGISPLPPYMTRRALIRTAEAHDRVMAEMDNMAAGIEGRSQLTNE